MNEVIELLIKNKKMISAMESCTGGGIVNAITNIPNASKVISFGAVTSAALTVIAPFVEYLNPVALI